MEAVANAASDLGRDAGRFLDLTGWSWIMASAHGAGVMLIPSYSEQPAAKRSAQSAITIFQFVFGRWRCARSYHLAYRRGRNHRLAGLRLHWPGRAAPIVVQCRL